MIANSNRLLIVDDEAGVRNFLSTVAGQLGFEVHSTGDADGFAAVLTS